MEVKANVPQCYESARTSLLLQQLHFAFIRHWDNASSSLGTLSKYSSQILKENPLFMIFGKTERIAGWRGGGRE